MALAQQSIRSLRFLSNSSLRIVVAYQRNFHSSGQSVISPRALGDIASQNIRSPQQSIVSCTHRGDLHAPHEMQIKAFSSNAGSGGFSPMTWWRNRQEKNEAEKYKKRLKEMSEKEAWTIGDMLEELDEVVKSWASRLPGISDNKETKMAKQMHKTVNGVIQIVGKEATGDVLDGMSRTDKLKAALSGETTVESVNILVQQFQSMSLMHRIIRKRKLDGRPLPESPEAMQAVMQSEGSGLLSKAQRNRMMDNQARMLRKAARRR